MKKQSPLLWIFRRVRRRIPALLLMTTVHVGQALFGVAFALGTRGVIDSAISGSSAAFWHACLVQGAIILGILICLTLFRHLKERISADLDRDWKKDLLHGLLHGEYEAVAAFHSGELINRLNNDVRTVDDGLVSTLPNVASMVTKLIAAMAVLVALEPRFSLVVVAAGIFVVLATAMMRRRLKGLHKQVSEADGKVSGFLQETLEKLLMVQAMDVSDEMERRADVLLDHRYEIQRRRKNVSLFANTSVSVLSYGAGFAALGWCAFGLLRGTMSFGSLTAVTQLVGQLQGPFVNLSGVIPQYISMVAAAERLMELETLSNHEDIAQKNADTLYDKMTALRADDLSFSYDRDKVLTCASFSLPKGAFAVITGPSGVGKSTLLKLMLGIFHPNHGNLCLVQGDNSIPLNRRTRKLFAYVPQGNLLLSGTLRENLIITRPKATEEEIQQAVYVSAMDDYLSQLPQGLDTVLGENSAGLSEGQAQRLAIARAILSGAPILLLDEITSALDSDTEQLVLRRIRELPGRTCIAVTHRPAILELADWKLEVSENGIRAECLRPETLLR